MCVISHSKNLKEELKRRTQWNRICIGGDAPARGVHNRRRTIAEESLPSVGEADGRVLEESGVVHIV